jgi:MFS family permease
VSAVAHVLSPALAKEVRALLPTYCAALVLVVVGSFSNSYTVIASGLLGFAFGSVALGAQSFGHEYSHRTLGLLLSQPLDRRRLFFYKVAVLSVMLTTLTATTLVMYHELLRRAASPHTEPKMLVLAAACGLFMAPCLTMICRSTLAAVVFTIAIPGLLATGADVAGGIIYGLQNAAAIDRFRLVVFWRGMFVICAVSAIAAWQMFQRLEVIEGQGSDVQFPESLRIGPDRVASATAKRHHPVWALIKKDLRLQQITFVVAGLFVCVWVGLAWMERIRPDSPTVPLISLTVLYAGILAMLTGSLASAEERHLGTAEWQMLLPMAAWRQWTVKVGVVCGIVVALGVAVPALLGLVISIREWFTPLMAGQVAAIMVLLTAGSLYLSSLCKSGVGALVLSFPSVVATVLLVQTIGSQLRRAIGRNLASDEPFLDSFSGFFLLIAVVGGFVALLLWLAFVNHRTADRSVDRIAKQVLSIAGYVATGLAVLILLVL